MKLKNFLPFSLLFFFYILNPLTAWPDCETKIDGYCRLDVDIILNDGIPTSSAPATSNSGQSISYFDSTLGKLRCSEDGGAFADCVGGGGTSIPADTVANLPGSPATNDLATVTDAADNADCTVGGGTDRNLCIYSGTAWLIIGDGTAAASSGDSVTVNSVGVDTTANFKDTASLTFALVDGGGGGPDDVEGTVVVQKDLVTTAPLTGGTNNIFPGADADITVAITLLKDVVATSPLLVNGTTNVNDILPGADSDLTFSIPDAAADASTKGASTYTARDFSASSGVISSRKGDFFNGSFAESFDADVTSNGTTITMSIEQTGTGNLTSQFSSGNTAYTTAPDTIALSGAGTEASPQGNWVYILESAPTTLVLSTSAWPTTEHIKIGFFFCASPTQVQTAGGCIVNQNWNDHLMGTDSQGHMTHMAEKLRRIGPTYFSGIAGNGATASYYTISASNTEFISTSGVVEQLHEQTFPAMNTSTGSVIYVVNSSVSAYRKITDLFSITTDSTGTTIGNNKYFNLTIWGVINKTGELQVLMVNVPGGFYNSQSSAENDASGFDVFTIPREFGIDSSNGFLIARTTFRMNTTWTHASTVDLRGTSPQTASGGVGGSPTDFADNTFTVFDNTDDTKVLAFDVGTNLTTATTRTLKAPDASGNIALTSQTDGTLADADIPNTITIDLATTVTTNANLTGPITSVGNITSVASQTGTGTTFVMNTSPTLVTPTLGVATATSVNKLSITAPATSATLVIADGKTFTLDNTVVLGTTLTDTKYCTYTAAGTVINCNSTPAGSSPLTTKGDIYTYDTSDQRLAIGTDAQVLTADSTQATGMKWAASSGSGDVVGPASSTDNAITRFDSTTGKLIQDSSATVSDTGEIGLPTEISVKLGSNTFFTEINGESLLSSNAYYTGTQWDRIDVNENAILLQLQGGGLGFPSGGTFQARTSEGGQSDSFAIWKSAPAANPITDDWTSSTGWNLQLGTIFGNAVIGGQGIELDGSGTTPFGRIHNGSAMVAPSGSPNVGALNCATGSSAIDKMHQGIGTNIFANFTCMDNSTKESWFAGFSSTGTCTGNVCTPDRYVIKQLDAETAITDANFAPLFTIESDGTYTFKETATPTTAATGEMALDTDGWGTGFDAYEIFNGTASAYIPAITATDTCTDGQVAQFNTGGEWTCETIAGTGDMVLADVQTVTGAKTFGTIGGAVGKLILAGSTSGSSILNAAATAGTTTVTLPGSTDTLVGKATTDTLTNKTFDANGTGNSLSNVDVADLANGTDGELITWSATGVPAVVAVGTAAQVLTSNGVGVAPTFQAATGGGDVSKVGTPTNSQVGVWTGDGTIEGAASLTYDGSNFFLTGDIGSTGTRITKGWFTDLQVTNAIAGSITGNSATVTTITGLAPDTATTQATQASITTAANLVTVGALGSGTIASGFGNIDNGSSSITTTGTIAGITAANLVDKSAAETISATWTFADASLLDFGSNVTSATEGLILPGHATDCTTATAQGQTCWEEDAKILYVGDGTSPVAINASGGTHPIAAGDYAAASIDGDDINSSIAGNGLTLTVAAPDTLDCDTSSLTAVGCIEVATVAETDTGTDATRSVSPDGLAGSEFGERVVQVIAFDFTTDTAVGDGAFYFHIDSRLGGMNLVDVHAEVITAGTTNTTDIQIANVTQAADMLTTKITIDSAETGSDTAATAAVIDTANDDVAENDVIRIDVDAVSTTAAKGLLVTMGFRLP